MIFDPYFSTKEKDSNKGSGLGLSIVRSIILKHNGSVTIQSNLKYGSTVTIYLPAAQNEPRKDKDIEQILPSGKGHVVVIDEEQEVHDLTQEMLSYLGYAYVGCYSLEDALVEVEKLVEDVESPVIVLVSISANGESAETKIVDLFKNVSDTIKLILSHVEENGAIFQKDIDSGFDAQLIKPFQLLDLSRVLSAVTQKI
jgi:CheY-like chemotaxis protein